MTTLDDRTSSPPLVDETQLYALSMQLYAPQLTPMYGFHEHGGSFSPTESRLKHPRAEATTAIGGQPSVKRCKVEELDCASGEIGNGDTAAAKQVRATIGLCEHGRRRSRCKDCGGSAICQHGRVKYRCKECGGNGICDHGRRKSQCKDCGGSGICDHGRRKFQCKDCGGSGICEHGRRKSRCKDCGGSGICEHGRRKYRCKDCSSTAPCAHGLAKSACEHCRVVKPAPPSPKSIADAEPERSWVSILTAAATDVEGCPPGHTRARVVPAPDTSRDTSPASTDSGSD
jgi:hypothetical protein